MRGGIGLPHRLVEVQRQRGVGHQRMDLDPTMQSTASGWWTNANENPAVRLARSLVAQRGGGRWQRRGGRVDGPA